MSKLFYVLIIFRICYKKRQIYHGETDIISNEAALLKVLKANYLRLCKYIGNENSFSKFIRKSLDVNLTQLMIVTCSKKL